MTTFESNITVIPANIERIFATLSDLTNLERLKAALPADKASQIKEMTFDTDSLTILSLIHI